MTNATIQKVCNLTLGSFSRTHRYALGGGAWGHRGYVRYIHVQCSRLGTPAVNHIYRVHLRWGYVFRGCGGFVVLGNMS